MTREKHLPQSSQESSNLSIANLERQHIEGPGRLHQLINFSRHADSIAIDYCRRNGARHSISYSELDALSSKLAARLTSTLRRHDLSSDEQVIVPILLPQCPALYISELAALKAGTAFCPLSLDVPLPRLNYILNDVRAKVIISTKALADKIKAGEISFDLVTIDERGASDASDAAQSWIDNGLRAPPQETSSAYIMYTSGTTGLPKGVVLSHKAVIQSLLAHDEHVPQFERFLQFASPTFDVSIFEIFFPLFRGATVVCCDREEMLADLPGSINRACVDAAELTPTVVSTLIRSQNVVPSLRLLLTIGEALTKSIIEEFAASDSRDGILLPAYGPTEAAIHCTIHPRIRPSSNPKNIGQPLSSVTAFILNIPDNEPGGKNEILPLEVEGELAIAGQLADGYLNRHTETVAAFIDLQKYGRIYRTGDRARMSTNHDIEYLGRISAGQVKLRGQRVELGEIEQVACKSSGIYFAQALVIADSMVLFCKSSQQSSTPASVQRTCNEWLPRYMRPEQIILLEDDVPRLPSGKIDRKNLEALYQDLSLPKSEEAIYANDAEERIAAVVCEALGSKLGRDESLRHHGLTSLKAIRIASVLRDQGLDIAVYDILMAENICELGDSCKTALDKDLDLESAQDAEVSGNDWLLGMVYQSLDHTLHERVAAVHPCSQLQCVMLAETVAHAELNFNSIQLSISDDISADKFLEAFEILAQRNEILRTGFVQIEDAATTFVQVVWRSLRRASLQTVLETTIPKIENPINVEFSFSENGLMATFRLHHAIYDGWSWGIIEEDLNKLVNGREVPERLQYHKFVYAETQILQSVNSSDARDFWTQHLRSCCSQRLPSLTKNNSNVKHGARKQRCTNIELHGMRDIARDLHISLQSIASAALAHVLSSHLGTDSAVLGCVMSGRTLPMKGIEDVLGPCITIMPYFIDLLTGTTVKNLLRRSNRLHDQMLQYAAVDLGTVGSAEAGTSARSLFDVLFVWQEGNDPAIAADPFASIKTVASIDTVKHTLILEFEPNQDDLLIKATYRTDLITITQVESILEQVRYLLKWFVTQPNSPMVNVWSSICYEQLSIAGTSAVDSRADGDLISNFEKLVTEGPDRLAIKFVQDFDISTRHKRAETLTYFQLDMMAEELRHTLEEKGATHNVIVAICMPKALEAYIAIVAIAKAGAALVVIDPDLPAARRSEIIATTRCSIICLKSDLSPLLEGLANCDIVYVDASNQPKLSKGQPRRLSKPSDLAYAIFTSGTTGKPKGLLINQGNLRHNLQVLSEIYPHSRGGHMLQSSSLSFDLSMFEIFFTWHNGMCLVSATNDVLFRDLEAFIDEIGITHLSMTPSVAALLQRDKIPSVQILVTAGEPLTSQVYSEWADKGLYNGYGPAETTNICTVKPMFGKNDLICAIGRPLPGTLIVISAIDRFCPLPKGSLGEIVIGGSQVGPGYIDDLDDATKSFFHHPIHGRLYRSGDLGRMTADGSIIIAGRTDDQVKIRGQRVELGEVNANVSGIDIVQNASTMLSHDESVGRDQLVSFWVPSVTNALLNSDISSKHIFRQLEATLPRYMIPDALCQVRKLPITSQGKVDKRKLSSILHSEKNKHTVFFRHEGGKVESPSTITERMLAEVLETVTGTSLNRVGIHSSLISYGLDSIKAMRFARQASLRLDTRIDVSAVIGCGSIRRLADHIENVKPGASFSQAARSARIGNIFQRTWISALSVEYHKQGLHVLKVLPCTPLQDAMLISSQDKETSYQNQMRFAVASDPQRLKAAWSEAVAKHQILRTAFVMSEQSDFVFAQVVLKEYKLPWYDRPQATDPKPAVSLPPYRLQYSSFADNSSELLLLIHHALYDAEAMWILLQDVEQIYNRKGAPASSSFGLYIEYMLGLNVDRVDKFWISQLRQHNSRLLAGRFAVSSTSAEPDHKTISADSNITLCLLDRASRERSVTHVSLVQTALTKLLSFYHELNDVLFGNVFSGRDLPIQDIDNVVGPAFNTLPVRVKLFEGQTNAELAAQILTTNLRMSPFQPSSLRRIQQQHAPGGARLFDILLLYQTGAESLDKMIWTLTEESGNMDFPFIIEAQPHQGEDALSLQLHHSTSVIGTEDALQLLANFDLALEDVVRNATGLATNYSIFSKPNLVRVSSLDASKSTTSSRTPQELATRMEDVQSVLSQLLAIKSAEIQPQSTIFKLGIDSISAAQVASKLRGKGYAINIGEIMEGRTVVGVAEKCLSKSDEAHSAGFDLQVFDRTYRHKICQTIDVLPQNVQSVRPCTTMQCGILTEFLRSNGKIYLNTMSLTLANDIDTRKLRRAWTSAITRHEMLRSGFVHVDSSQFPFAMITYDMYDIRAMHQAKLDDDFEYGEDQIESIASEVVKNLHLPPWRVYVAIVDSVLRMNLVFLHALYDAQSLDTILTDVARFYHGEKLATPTPVSMKIEQILGCAQTRDSSAEAFWRSTLQGAQSATFPELTTHRTQNLEMVTAEYQSQIKTSLLRTSCQNLNVTMQAAVHCAWGKLLAAYTGEQKVTFGVTLSGRDEKVDEDRVAFPCINTMPFAVKSLGSNAEMLENANTSGSMLISNQYSPVSRVKKWLNIEGRLFDTIVVLQRYNPEGLEKELWSLEAEHASAEYAVSLEVFPRAKNQILYHVTTNSRIMGKEHALLLLKQFDCLLLDLLNNPEELATSTPKLESEIISAVVPKYTAIPTKVQLLHDFVENSALTYPDRIALKFATSISSGEVHQRSWTYQDLVEKSNTFANMIIREGVEPGQLIGICFDKCPEAYFSILGILKAGCAYVALDPTAPSRRKNFILEDSSCKILLTTTDKVSQFSDTSVVKVIAVDNSNNLIGSVVSAPMLSRSVSPDDPCYCLYTSGTTGTPKGCLITHSNAVQAILSFQRLFAEHWDQDSRWLQFASFHFDVSVLEQYWSWSVGICVTSVPRDLLFEDLPAAIRALDITHIDLTPSLARLLTPNDVPSLCRGVFITGGEQLRQDILDVWGDHAVIYNGYGPSEVTIGCTMYPRVPRSAKATNIGHAFDNVGAFVLDPKTKRPVIRGGIGELCVYGPLVGKGYLNRPGLTAQKFELVASLGQRIYHTGDLVRMLADGSFDFLGRIDDQVKLRGQRLEIGEINHVLSHADPRIKDAASLLIRHPSHPTEQLISFISMKRQENAADISLHDGGNALSLISISRNACLEQLPNYMVPTQILPITSIPLSANNKAETTLLKKFFEGLPIQILQRLTKTETSLTPKQQEVATKIKSELKEFLSLDVRQIQASSRFFEIGLDSISALGFCRRLRAANLLGATPALILKCPTIADLAVKLTEEHGISREDGPLQRARGHMSQIAQKHREVVTKSIGLPFHAIMPCTPLQEGMLAKTVNGENKTYFSTFNFELAEHVDTFTLRKAWRKAAKRNDMLRTVFVPTEDGYVQTVLRDSSARIRHLDVMGEQDLVDRLNADSERWKKNTSRTTSQMWEVLLLTSAKHKFMSLRIFHALYDGISLTLLLEEVANEYHGKYYLNKLPFRDVLPHILASSTPEAESYWKSVVAKPKLLDLPSRQDCDKATQLVSSTIISGLRGFKNRLGVTEPSIFQAAWLLTLFNHFGVVPSIGIVVSGRALDVDEIDRVVGPLFNTLPCSIKIDQLRSSPDLIYACHNFNMETLALQHSALRDIAKWQGIDASQPMFDSLFVYQKPAKGGSMSDMWEELPATAQADYPLAFDVQQGENETFTFTIVAQARFVTTDMAEALVADFQSVVKSMIVRSDYDLPEDFITSGPRPVIDKYTTRKHTNEEGIFKWTDEARTLQKILASLTNIPTVQIEPGTSIFELGLDSIDAIKVSARLKSAGLKLSVSRIMRLVTLANMTQELIHFTSAEDGLPDGVNGFQDEFQHSLEEHQVDLKNYESILPVTPLQEAMLASYAQYYGFDLLEINPEIDTARLGKALRDVVATHPILRASFVPIDDTKSSHTFVQAIVKPSAVECVATIVAPLEQLSQLITNKQQEVKKAGSGYPPLDITMLTCKDKRFLLLGMSHAIYDGWSINLLHQDIARLYAGDIVSRPSFIGALSSMVGEPDQITIDFWTQFLNGFNSVAFPRRETLHNQRHERHLQEMLASVPADHAQAFCKSQNITMQVLALACWSIVLASRLRCTDVCFGVVLSGRTREDAGEMMFPLMNTVVFRSQLSGSIEDFLQDCQRRSTAVAEHQTIPLRKVKHMFGNERSIFDTLFIFQRQARVDEKLPELYHSAMGSSGTEYPVNSEMEVVGQDLIWRTACSSIVLSKAATRKLLTALDGVLQHIIAHTGEALATSRDNRTSFCGLPAVVLVEPDKGDHGSTSRATSVSRKEENWTDIELVIRDVLAEIGHVPVELVSRDATLFNIGLDSISAIKASSQLRRRGIRLPVSKMIETLTIKNMAQATQREDQNSNDNSAPGKPLSIQVKQVVWDRVEQIGCARDAVESIVPSSAGQEYVLSMCQVSEGELFDSHFYYKSTSILDHAQLQRAWKILVDYLPILRTVFLRGRGASGAYQVVFRELKCPIAWFETEDKRNEAFETAVKLSAHTDEKHTYLSLNIHHAFYDAISLPAIMGLLQDCYNEQQLPTSTRIPFDSFICSTQVLAVEQRRRFWTTYLRGPKRTPSPEVSKSPAHSFSPRNEVYRPSLLSSVSNLEKRCRNFDISIQSLFIACLARTLRSNKDLSNNVMIGLYLSNRSLDIPNLAETPFPVFNVVPLKIHVTSECSLIDSARNVQADIAQISKAEHCGVSLREIYEWTGMALDVYVNFLKDHSNMILPKAHGRADDVQITPISKAEARARIPASLVENKGVCPWIERAPDEEDDIAKQVFLPSLDVEAAVRHGGLDVGVFASEDRMSAEQARVFVKVLKVLLDDVGQNR